METLKQVIKTIKKENSENQSTSNAIIIINPIFVISKELTEDWLIYARISD